MKTTEQEYSSVIEQATDGIFVSDETGKYVDANLNVCKMLGYSKEEFLNLSVHEILPHEEGKDNPPKIGELLAGESIFRTGSIRKKDGELIPVEITSKRLSNGNLLGMVRDISEKKDAEEKLKRSERLFRAMIERNADMMTLTQPDGKLLYVSPSVTNILGFSFEEYRKRLASDFVHPDDVPGLIEQMIGIVDSPGKSFFLQQRLMHKDGTYRWCEGTVTNMLHDPDIGALVSNFRDVSERKEGEKKLTELNEELEQKVIDRTAQLEDYIRQLEERGEQLIKSNQLFFDLFNHNPASIAISSMIDGKLIDVNDGFLQLNGYSSKEEVVGKTTAELNMPVHLEQRAEIVRLLKENKSLKNLEINIYDKQGNKKWIQLSAIVLEVDKVPCLFSVSIDITERKKGEEQLEKANELLSRLFEHNPASIVISRLNDAKIIDVNEAFLSSFGFSSKEEVLGKTARELKIVAQPEQREELTQLLKRNKAVKDFEIKAYSQQGKVFWISTSIQIIDIEDSPCLFSISIDISNRKKIEEQLQKVNKELDAFSYSVSHDLRAPLRSIIGYSKMIREDYAEKLEAGGRRMLDVIQQSGVKMNNLIEDLLKFSRLGGTKLLKSEIDIEKLVRSVLDEMNSSIQHKAEIRLTPLPPIYGDRALLSQVWINLISNAIKYSAKRKNPIVEIGSHSAEKEIVYYVKDNGAGFDMQYIDRLFGVFQRLHKATEFEGTGVGLALVHRIVAKHDGCVWAEGKVNEGATFYFSLPKNPCIADA